MPVMEPAPPTHARGHLLTEQRNSASAALDALSVEATLRLINTLDFDVPRAVRDAIPQITALVEAVVERMRGGGRLIYLGAGTSGRLGVLDASECPPTFHSDPGDVIGIIAGGDGALRRSSEGREDEWGGAHAELDALQLTAGDTVVGIAAGGTTPYVWGGLERAKQAGCATGMIVCVPIRSLMSRPRVGTVRASDPLPNPGLPRLPVEIDFPIELLVGPEAITGSTRMKAGTATKLALNMISTTAMAQLGKAWGNLMVDVRATNAKLRDRAVRTLLSQLDIGRQDAERLLDRAAGRVKPALVMARLRVSLDEAERLLAEHAGRLRPILGPPR
jgi:N-acetylmuramic acid 6-phosphate etherase